MYNPSVTFRILVFSDAAAIGGRLCCVCKGTVCCTVILRVIVLRVANAHHQRIQRPSGCLLIIRVMLAAAFTGPGTLSGRLRALNIDQRGSKRFVAAVVVAGRAVRRDVAVRGIGHGIGRGTVGPVGGFKRNRPGDQRSGVHADRAGKRAAADQALQFTVSGCRLGKIDIVRIAGQACHLRRGVAFEVIPCGGVARRRRQRAVDGLRAVHVILERFVVGWIQIDRFRDIERERRKVRCRCHGRACAGCNKHPRAHQHENRHQQRQCASCGRCFGSFHKVSSFNDLTFLM